MGLESCLLGSWLVLLRSVAQWCLVGVSVIIDAVCFITSKFSRDLIFILSFSRVVLVSYDI